ncbi:MAG TPA: hypothetical protein VK526_06785, partial [Bradyrhizobium sp.]|nr:hypothetical protein [Bradyrhizobium sp.]
HRPRRRELSFLITLFLTAMNPKPGLAPGFLFGGDRDLMCFANPRRHSRVPGGGRLLQDGLGFATHLIPSPDLIYGTRQPPPRLVERV